jgi:glycosyltransferase involved in cell wall biosynthesis
MGGATVDIDEVLFRWARDHDVRLFVPRFPWPFSRCAVAGERPYPVERIPVTPLGWTWGRVGRLFRRPVERFRPDLVLVADGWHLKPEIFAGLIDHRPWLRIYAYENLCLVNNGTFFADGAFCGNHLLADAERCRRCARRQPVAGFWYRQERLAGRALAPDYPRRVQAMLEAARGIIVYNRLTAGILAPYNRNVRIVPSGVDTTRLRPAEPADGREPPLILAPGRMGDPVKGMGVLVAAADLLHRRGHRFRLVATALERHPPRPYLELPGWVGPEAMSALYRRAAVVAVPSLWPEPQGIVAVEAMAAGVPVVASRIGGLPDIIAHEITGFLVPPGDHEALAKHLALLLEDAELRRRMGRAARARAVEHYDWEVIYREHYRHLAAGDAAG